MITRSLIKVLFRRVLFIAWNHTERKRLKYLHTGFQEVAYKVIYPKYSKHWPYTVARKVDCVCSKMLNHGLFFSLFKLITCHIHWIVYVLAYSNVIPTFGPGWSNQSWIHLACGQPKIMKLSEKASFCQAVWMTGRLNLAFSFSFQVSSGYLDLWKFD